MKSNTFVIGDIHGGLAALKQVIQRAGVATQDTLIFLGDYLDGWSESAGVIEYLMELSGRYTCIFLRGNHDEIGERWLKTNEMSEDSLRHGGAATIKSYETLSEEMKQKHVRFLESLNNYYIDDRNRLFVHGGFTSQHGPRREHHESYLYWERTLWEMVIAMDKNLSRDSVFFPKRLKLFHEIYIGHTPTIDYSIFQPMNIFNVWNVDTGAGFNGSLTLLNVDTKEFWQSDPVKTLYPDEVGRKRG